MYFGYIKKALLNIFLLLLCACVDGGDGACIHSSIYGGEQVEMNDFSGVVSLKNAGEPFCSGAVISSNQVLTAAHCVKSFKFELSKTEIRSDYNAYSVRSFLADPSYYGGGHDFAIIEIEGEFEQEDIYAFVPNRNLRVGERVTVVGFGEDEEGHKGIKRSVEVSISVIRNFDFVAGGEGLSSCHGDSGGPAFIKNVWGQYKILGVVHGKRYAADECGDEAVYGRVDILKEWLKSIMIL